jgi:HAD superfamily hydrolase (TIGR01549 family)
MSEIRNIIFDLGGVLINIDYDKTRDAFTKLGVENFEEMYAQFKADALFEELETGGRTEEQFYNEMCRRTGDKLIAADVQKAWNAMLLDFRKESFVFLEQLKSKYNLYLLSNTNIIHKAAFDSVFQEQTGFENMDAFFIKAYYSHLIGMRKPNENIYNFVLQDAGIYPAETLFIDDSVNNLEAAEKAGISTLLLKPGELIEEVLPGVLG